MLAFLVSLGDSVNMQIAILFCLVLTLSSPHTVQPTPPPVKPLSRPNPSSPCQAIKPPKPLLPLSSCQAVQHPPPRQAHPIFCLMLRWLAPPPGFPSFGWLSSCLAASLHLSSRLCLFFVWLVVAPTNRIHPLPVLLMSCCWAIKPSSLWHWAIALGHSANLGLIPSNHQSVQTHLPLVKLLIRPTPSSPRQPIDLSKPLLLLSRSTFSSPRQAIKPSKPLLPLLSCQAVRLSHQQWWPIVPLAA